MLIASFELGLLYALIYVHNYGLEYPFNDLRDQHIAQGFSWRPGSVSFKPLNLSFCLAVEVWLEDKVYLRPDTVRAILVPFSITSSEGVVITDVTAADPGDEVVLIPEGEYALVFETGFREEYRNNPEYRGEDIDMLPTWCRFTFVPGEGVQAAILRVDAELSPVYPLLMEAQPAGMPYD
jgi:hypothetical protein